MTPCPASAEQPLLQIQDLKIHFPLSKRVLGFGKDVTVHAVDGVSLDVRRGETVGLIGARGRARARCPGP